MLGRVSRSAPGLQTCFGRGIRKDKCYWPEMCTQRRKYSWWQFTGRTCKQLGKVSRPWMCYWAEWYSDRKQCRLLNKDSSCLGKKNS